MCRFIIVQQPRYAAITTTINDVHNNSNNNVVNAKSVNCDKDEKYKIKKDEKNDERWTSSFVYNRSDSTTDSGVESDAEHSSNNFDIEENSNTSINGSNYEEDPDDRGYVKESEDEDLLPDETIPTEKEKVKWTEEQKRQQRRNFGYFRQKSYHKCSMPSAECLMTAFRIAIVLAMQEMDYDEDDEKNRRQWKQVVTEKLKFLLSEEDFCDCYHNCQTKISRKFLLVKKQRKEIREISSDYEEQKFLEYASDEDTEHEEEEELTLEALIDNLSREMTNLKVGVTQYLENFAGLECIKKGGVNNIRKGYNLLRLAASAELPMALYNLGVLCDQGYGLKNPKHLLAFKCFERASELRHYGAKFNLAVYYSKGRIVKANKVKAKNLMVEAALGGLPEARAIVFKNQEIK